MLEMVIETTNDYIKELKDNYAGTNKILNLVTFSSDFITESILRCVFGMTIKELGKIDYYSGGFKESVHPGAFIKKNFASLNYKISHILRSITSIFDKVAINASEREDV